MKFKSVCDPKASSMMQLQYLYSVSSVTPPLLFLSPQVLTLTHPNQMRPNFLVSFSALWGFPSLLSSSPLSPTYYFLSLPTVLLTTCTLTRVCHTPRRHWFVLVYSLCLWSSSFFLLPALLVCVLEPDWSFLDALFFCFVTLSTVGQGGNSPGMTWSATAKETLELLITCKWNGV